MRGTRFRRSVGSLTLCLGAAALFNCALDADGKLDLSPQEGSGGVGGEGGGMGAFSGGASGAEAGGGQAGGAMGMGGAGSAGAGGDSGGAGEGQGGGFVGPKVPIVLNCKPWLPGNPAWRFAGDAAQDGKRIELTSAGGANRWGQAYFDFAVTPTTSLEIAFTFAFEPREAGGDVAEGAAFWLARNSDFGATPPASSPKALGVPAFDVGAAVALDMLDDAAPAEAPSWGLYFSGTGDGTLSAKVTNETSERSVDASRLTPEGPHTAIVRLTRRELGDDGIADDLAISFAVEATPELPSPPDFVIENGETFLDNTRLGFGAGTGAGGARHRLLAVELKVDDVCREPP
jgi:hypothetical protein